jgi:MFS family permease
MATNLAGTVLAVPLAWYFVRFSLWLPMLLGFGCILSSTLLTLLIPETLDRQKEHDPARETLLDGNQDGNNHDIPVHKALPKTLITHLVQFLHQLQFVFASPLLTILAVTFFANSLGRSVLMLLLQFASNRFDITLSEASLLMPLSATLNFAVLVIILPWIHSHPINNHDIHDAATKDLNIARASIILLVLGLVGIALSPHIAVLALAITVYALGAGYSGASRSLVTSFVDRDQVGRLYAVLAMLDTAGTVVSGPALSKLFGWGLALGGLWSGMPFFFVALLFGLVGVVIWVIRLPDKGNGEVEAEVQD